MSDQPPTMKPVPSPVSESLIMICEKCGKKLAGTDDPEQNPSRQLQQTLKAQVKETLGKGVVRPIVVSCMDICPKDEVAVAVMRLDGSGRQGEFFCLPKDQVLSANNVLLEHARKK